jgi:hypothetical protein
MSDRASRATRLTSHKGAAFRARDAITSSRALKAVIPNLDGNTTIERDFYSASEGTRERG